MATNDKRRSHFTVSTRTIELNIDGIKEELLSAMIELQTASKLLDKLDTANPNVKRDNVEGYTSALHKIGLAANRLRSIANND